MSEHPLAILFERHGSWRTVPYLLFAVVFGIVGTWFLVGTVRRLAIHGLEGAQPIGMVLAPFFTAFFLGIAVLLIYRMVFDPGWSTRIDETGITMSRRLWPWSDVRRIFTKASRPLTGRATVSLNFHRRSSIPLDYGIQGFEFLTLDEADEILESLDAYLAKRHPDIDVELFEDEEE
jgi:hypothetical protein